MPDRSYRVRMILIVASLVTFILGTVALLLALQVSAHTADNAKRIADNAQRIAQETQMRVADNARVADEAHKAAEENRALLCSFLDAVAHSKAPAAAAAGQAVRAYDCIGR